MNQSAPAFQGVDVPSNDVLMNCIHCGLCLPHCPTFAVTGMETSSPRGRIRLIKAVSEAEIAISPVFIDEMEFCLDCRACETACPAGVNYSSLVEAARAQISRLGLESWARRIGKKVFLGWLFKSLNRFRGLARILRLANLSIVRVLLGKLTRMAGGSISIAYQLAPTINARFSIEALPERSLPPQKPARRVGFLTGCIMDVSYAEVNVHTVELLTRHGCEVIIPRAQGCCGSLHAHNGDPETTRLLAKKNISVFEEEKLDAIVVNSAGCGATMKQYASLLREDREWSDRAASFSIRVKDITEMLDEVGFRPAPEPGYPRGTRVTYHDACHLVHAQKISQQPRRLLKSVPGIEFVELEEASWCCGSAGIYNILRSEDSAKFLQRKIDCIKRTRPDVVVTGNPGCMLQLEYGFRKEGIPIDLVHTATFLWRACET